MIIFLNIFSFPGIPLFSKGRISIISIEDYQLQNAKKNKINLPQAIVFLEMLYMLVLEKQQYIKKLKLR